MGHVCKLAFLYLFFVQIFTIILLQSTEKRSALAQRHSPDDQALDRVMRRSVKASIRLVRQL